MNSNKSNEILVWKITWQTQFKHTEELSVNPYLELIKQKKKNDICENKY